MKKKGNRKQKQEAWFRKLDRHKNSDWGFVPINWRGWTLLILLVALNIFSANYFELRILSFENWSKFLIVFLLSLFVFIEIAILKTKD